MTLQELWNLGNMRRQALAFAAANPNQPGWRSCAGSPDPMCPIGGYWYDPKGVGDVQHGPPDATPEMAAINRAIMAGTVVLNDDGNPYVLATGQPVGLIGGVIVLPGQPVQTTPVTQPVSSVPGSLTGPITQPNIPPATALTAAQVTALASIPGIQAAIGQLRAALASLGVTV